MTITSDTPMSLEAAEAQQAEICRIMVDRQLNFGPAIDHYIKQQQAKYPNVLVDTSGWDAA